MYNSACKISDHDIADEVLSAFKWNWQIPGRRVKISVVNGWLTLEGDVEWNYQREAAYRSVTNLVGVRGVTNSITIDSETHDEIERHKIEMELVQDWSIDDEDIHVNVIGENVILSGIVHSFFQKSEAGRIAGNSTGVRIVENELVIDGDD